MSATVLAIEVFVASPGPGVGAHGASYYTERTGGRLIGVHGYQSRSDTVDVAFVRASEDNGRTWSAACEWPTRFDHPGGIGRRHPRGGYVDPVTGRYLTLWTEGVLPTDYPLEGMRQWTLCYAVSEDGGRATPISEQIIAAGPEFDAVHHLPGITRGRNCAMIGDLTCRPLTRGDGVILVPIQSSPVGPDGDYYNPGGSFTYTDSLVLLGYWRADGRLAWHTSARVIGDPERSTRGMIEPTLAELEGGRLLMVLRGSNDQRPALPGYRWQAVSDDGGETWTTPEPWTYDDGTPFFSPSACSQLIPWRDGRLFWLGNITPDNPNGNSPRYPLVLGEVDRRTGRLLRDTLSIIDNRREGDDARLTLSNFYAREDRETGHLLLHLSRYFAHGNAPDWTADALIYRIAVG